MDALAGAARGARDADGIPLERPWKDRGLLGVALFALVATFARLGEGTLAGDSVLYAAVTKCTIASGDWWTLKLGDAPYFNKPPLYFWLTGGLFELLGPTSFAARFWSALFGFAAVLATYALGRHYFERGTALLAAIVLVITHGFLSNTAGCRLETAGLFFMLAAFLEFTLAKQRGETGRLWRVGLWLGLGALAKWAYALFGLLWIAVFAIWNGDAKLFARRAFAAGMVCLLVLAGGWPALQWALHGDAYVDQAFRSEVVARITTDAFLSTSAWIYPRLFLETYWPWLPVFLLGLVRFPVRRSRPEAFRMIVAWVVPTLILILFPHRKYGRYLMPLWPACALVTGHALAQLLGARRVERVARFLPVFAVGVALALLCLPIRLRRNSAEALLWAAPLLHELEPGRDRVDCYLDGSELRQAQVLFYLDKPLEVFHDLDALERGAGEIVLAGSQGSRELVEAGWPKLFSSYDWSVHRRPAGASAARTASSAVSGDGQRDRSSEQLSAAVPAAGATKL